MEGLEQTLSALRTTQEKVAVLSADAADAKLLATYRDPIKRWFTRRAKAVGMDWPTLAGKLDLEQEGSHGENSDSPTCTDKYLLVESKFGKGQLLLARLARHSVNCRCCKC